MSLTEESGLLMNDNESLEEPLRKYIQEQDQITGYADKLRKLGNLKGKSPRKYLPLPKSTSSLQRIRFVPLVHRQLMKTLE